MSDRGLPGAGGLQPQNARPLRLGEGARVLVYAPPGDHRWAEALASAATTGIGLEVAETSGARGRAHPWLRRRADRAEVIVAVDDLVHAAEAAVEYDVPILRVPDGARPDGVGDRLVGAVVRSETLLRIQAGGRSSRTALAECVVTPTEDRTVLRVQGDDGLDAALPVLRVVNHDPFEVMSGGGCEYTSPSMIGLCWTEGQPLADRVVPAHSRLTVRVNGSGTLAVDCDGGRLRSVTDRVAIGPGWRVPVVHPSPRNGLPRRSS